MVFKNMNKKQWLKIFLIIIVITIFRTMVQPLIPDNGISPFPPSVIVQAGLIPVAFVLYGIIMLGLLSVVFVLIQDGLPGTRLMKGITFSLSFGLLWFVYLLEPLPHGTWEIPSALYYPIVDGLTLASLGLLLGIFIAQDSPGTEKARLGTGIVALAAIPALFLAGRLLSYNVFHIYSSNTTRPFDTMLWTIVMGVYIGVMYLVLRPGLNVRTPMVKAAYFGIIVFGTNIFLNDMFMPIPFDMAILGMGTFSYEDMIVRTAMDVVSVTAGVYIFEKIIPVISGNAQTGPRGLDGQ